MLPDAAAGGNGNGSGGSGSKDGDARKTAQKPSGGLLGKLKKEQEPEPEPTPSPKPEVVRKQPVRQSRSKRAGSRKR